MRLITPETRRLIKHSFQTFIVALAFIGFAFILTLVEDLAVETKRPKWLIVGLESLSVVLFYGDALVIVGVMIKVLFRTAKDVFTEFKQDKMMSAEREIKVVLRYPNPYRMTWIISFAVAVALTPLVIVMKERVPQIGWVPFGIGILLLVAQEFKSCGIWPLHKRKGPSEEVSQLLITVPDGYRGLPSYEDLIALEIKPRKKNALSSDQLSLPNFPGFSEPTPKNSVRLLYDEAGARSAVISCDRYSALLISYLIDHLDEVTERSLAAGLKRFGTMEGGHSSELFRFFADKTVREIMKSDFRGNLLTTVNRGGEKVLKDLLKVVELKSKPVEEEKKQLANFSNMSVLRCLQHYPSPWYSASFPQSAFARHQRCA